MLSIPSGRTPTHGNLSRWVLPVLCLCSFSILFNTRAISPILVDISQEFGISVALAGSLGAAYSLPAVLLALFFGPVSDRYGRRRLILLGLSLLIFASLGAAFAPSFPTLLAFRILAGAGAAAVMPSVFAAIGDYFPYAERGRAMAWQVGITTMAIVVGLPIGSLLSGLFSWRWMFGLLTCVFIIVLTLVLTNLPHETTPTHEKNSGLAYYKASLLSILRNRSAVGALLASIAWGIFWQGWSTYNGAFFIQTFQISTEGLAPIFTIHGLATVFTSTISGRISDRFSKKSLAALALVTCAIVIALLTNLTVALWLSIAFYTLLAIPAGLRIVATNAFLTELVPKARGTMMALNSSAVQIGTIIGVTIGGVVIESTGGYALIGTIYGVMIFLAALILHFFVVEAGDPGTSSVIQPD